jgi:hypothetical protein
MSLMHAVKKFLSTVGSRTRLRAKSPRFGAETEKDRAEERGLKSRCVNPEYGCRFEVS